jgi:hypothetical protein
MPERAVRQGRAIVARRAGAARPQRDEPAFAPGVRTPGELLALQRTAGNRAVAGGLSVQRYAFVEGRQVAPTADGLDPAMQAFAGDQLIRAYEDEAEFRAHAGGTTDYLGNLPAGSTSEGTWVRFSPTGTNLLGEDHTKVTLQHVVRAVGTTSFAYEPFAVDVLPPGSQMRATYEAGTAARFQAFGVGGVADKRQFGGESLFPKMGFGIIELIPYLEGTKPLANLMPGKYLGQPVQRYLKIAWGHAADISTQVARRKFWQRIPAEVRALARAYDETHDALNGLITGLPVDGYLGTVLNTTEGQDRVRQLLVFSRAFVTAMLARAATDTGITKAERRSLRRMPRGTQAEKEAVFGDWRNLHFAHATRNAAARGVRYIGMGNDHLRYLRDEELPPDSHPFDMTGAGLDLFEARTRALRAKAIP